MTTEPSSKLEAAASDSRVKAGTGTAAADVFKDLQMYKLITAEHQCKNVHSYGQGC